jgi:alpha-L-fucosidase
MDRRAFLRTSSAAAGLVLVGGRGLAQRARPSPQQLAWQQNELSLLLHFGMNTFTDREWGDGTEDPVLFNPPSLDTRQWAATAKAAGFRTLILTAKHHDGFCLWPSRVTRHSVAASPWRHGQGDLVRELADACRAEGLGFGIYLSPWDRNAPSYGDSDRYNDFYCEQLTELLARYGRITEVWFDDANGEGRDGRRPVYDWPRIQGVVRQHQPEALIFSDAGPDLRRVGNERGEAGEPNWSGVDPGVVPYPGAEGAAITDMLQHGDPDGPVWRPAEADVSIRPGWFWHPAEDSKVRTAGELMDLYFSSVGRNAGLLLNVPPTREGRLHEVDVRRLTEFANRRERLFERDLTVGAARTASHDGRTLGLRLPRAVEFDVVLAQEDIRHGQNVSAHHVEVRWQGQWRTVAEGTTIGWKRLHRVPPTPVTEIRLVIEAAIDQPRISRLTLHNSEE